MRKFIIITFVFIAHFAHAQQPSLSHSPISPSLINPAYIGQKRTSEILLNHKQQWLGINEAPSVTIFQLSLPIVYPMSIGLGAQNYQRGAVNTNTFNALFAYSVPFGLNTGLTFGLAGGIKSMGLNSKSSYNIADPTVLTFADQGIQPNLNFGISYFLQNLRMGMSFTEMINADIYETNSVDRSDVKFYDNYIVNLDYKFQFTTSKIALQAFVLYTQDAFYDPYFDAGSLIHYDDLLYLGGSYRQNYGISILAGFQIKKFSLGYGYELASEIVNSIGQGSHELQLSYRFGKAAPAKKVKKKKAKPQIVEEVEDYEPDALEDTPEDDTLAKDVKDTKESPKTEQVQEDAFSLLDNTPAHTIYHHGNAKDELPVGFYVIAGAYHSKEGAAERTAQLSKENLFAAEAYNSERGMYLVFIYRTEYLEKAKIARDNFIQKASLKDAWLLQIKEK